MERITKLASKILFTSGFGVFLYCVVAAALGGPGAAENPAMTAGWVFIVLGLVMHVFATPRSRFWGGTGQRVIVLGWAAAAVGIFLDTHSIISNVLIVGGFITFGIGVFMAVPDLKK